MLHRPASLALAALAVTLAAAPPATAKMTAMRPGRHIVVADSNGKLPRIVGSGDFSVLSRNGRYVLIGDIFVVHPMRLVTLIGKIAVSARTLPCDVAEFTGDSTRVTCFDASLRQHIIDTATGVDEGSVGVSGCFFSPDGSRRGCYAIGGELAVTTLATDATVFFPQAGVWSSATFSRDGQRLLFMVGGNAKGQHLAVMTIATRKQVTLGSPLIKSFLEGPTGIALEVPGNRVTNVSFVRKNLTGLRRLTKYPGPVRGKGFAVTPQFFSANGRRLVADVGGEGLDEAYAVDVVRGGARRLGQGHVRATAISRSGRFVYGDTASHVGDPFLTDGAERGPRRVDEGREAGGTDPSRDPAQLGRRVIGTA